MRLPALVLVLPALLAGGCADRVIDELAGSAGASSGAGAGSSGPGAAGAGSSSGDPGGAGGSYPENDRPGAAHGIGFAHTGRVLYSVDFATPGLPITEIGPFDCLGHEGDASMTDVAVSAEGVLWGISATHVHRLVLQGPIVHCASTARLDNGQNAQFYALSFAPQGVLDPYREVLVAGNSAGELWAIDAQGRLSLHGNFGLVPRDDGNGHVYPPENQGKRWELSGDIVFLTNRGSPVGFATVRDCPSPPSQAGCSGTDTLVQIDLGKLAAATTGSVGLAVRGQVVKAAGCDDPVNASYGSMFGIAAWNTKVYGFSHQGAIVAIDAADGSACLTGTFPSSPWDGAGVTTLAPILAPPGK